MGSLALGLAGGIIGSFFGFPELGFVLGSIAGTLIFPPKGPNSTQNGPRIGDLSVMVSSYGQGVPIAYGTFRMSGNVIWAQPITEKEQTKKIKTGSKGMGGSAVTTNTFTYFGSFAVQFAQGPAAGVIRIWADKKLIYDGRAGQGGLVLPGLSFRFYPGNETQTPDSIIEAHVGAGLEPAHRGNCYIVFDTMPLLAFGNRLPSIEAEITFDANTENTSRVGIADTTGVFSNISGNVMSVDRTRRRIYLLGTGGTAQGGLRIFDMDTLVEVRQRDATDIFNTGNWAFTPGGAPTLPTQFNFNGGFNVGQTGFIYTALGTSNYDPVISIDPNVLSVKEIYGGFGNLSGTIPAVWAICETTGNPSLVDPTIPRYVASLTMSNVGGSLLSQIIIANDGNGGIVGVGGSGSGAEALSGGGFPVLSHAQGIVADRNDATTQGLPRWWVNNQDVAGGNVDLEIIRYDIDAGFSGAVFATLPPSTWANDAVAGSYVVGPIIDQRDSGLIFLVNAASGGCRVFKWVQNTPTGGTVVWSTKTTTPWPQDMNTICHESEVNSGRFGWCNYVGGTLYGALIDTTTGQIIVDQPVTIPAGWNVSIGNTQFYDGDSQSVYMMTANTGTILGQVYLGRISGNATTLDAIVEDISLRAGLTAAQINVSALASINVKGYALASQMPSSDALQPLLTAYMVDVVETNGVVKFVPRGSDPVGTFTKSELMLVSDTNQAPVCVQERRIQEWELPQTLSINFIDPELDYQPNSVAISRTGAPAAGTIASTSPDFESFQVPQITVGSVAAQAVNLAIVMSATEAVQLAETLLYTSWNERMSETFRGSFSMLHIDPADVITLDLENGTVLQIRASKATLNADFSTNFEGIVQDKATLVATKSSLGGFGLPQQVPPGQGATQLFMFDIPLLRDIDDTGGLASKLYVAMNGYTGNWPGGVLWRSADAGASFSLSGTRNNIGCEYGFAVNALPATDYPFQTDTTTQLHVIMSEGSLEGATQIDFLNNVNVALVGDPVKQNWELVLFRDAVQQTDGSYIVSTFMRGRRGTEVNCNTHGDGEFFILPSTVTFSTYLVATSTLDALAYFRGVGITELVEDSPTFTITPEGNDLKPYAPCHLAAAVAGSDIAISWVRRNRTLGDLKDGTGTVPNTEATESYSIDIFSGGSVIRTLTATSPAVTYTSAQITTDFGSLPATLTFAVYQISAVVGRGFEAKTTITF